MTNYDLHRDGPHSPDRTVEAAEAMAEARRVLNHATADPGGLANPGDVYTVLGELHLTVAGLPQLLNQMSAWLERQVADGAVGQDAGGAYPDARSASQEARSSMAAAVDATSQLAAELNRVQAAISGLHGTVDE